jgi:hypothetical protein
MPPSECHQFFEKIKKSKILAAELFVGRTTDREKRMAAAG